MPSNKPSRIYPVKVPIRTAFAVAPSPGMRLKPRGPVKRRVFFSEALRRVRQQSFPQRLRSIPCILRVAFKQAVFLIFTVLPRAPSLLLAYRSRVRVELLQCAFDLYGAHLPGPLIIFVHGGAWGGGTSAQHALVGKNMSTMCNAPVAIADQRVYPAADMREQATDVADIVYAARARFPGRRVVLVGHSSGAHSIALAIAGGLRVYSVVLQGGVFDPLQHFAFESVRGLETVSAMMPAARADEDVTRLAGYSVARCLRKREEEDIQSDAEENDEQSQLRLEGDIGAECIGLKQVADARDIVWDARGGTFVMAGGIDAVVPLSSSVQFSNALCARGVNARLLIYPHATHGDFILDWSRPPSVRRGAVDTGEEDATRRRRALTAAYGAKTTLLVDEKILAPNSDHARDLRRIIRATMQGESIPDRTSSCGGEDRRSL